MSRWLLIENGDLISGTGSEPSPRTTVLVKEDKIYAVGSDASRAVVPDGDQLEVIDASGSMVMPGLIDAHCHMSYGEAQSEEEIDLYTSHELRTLKAAWNLQKVLAAGVTSVSDPGGSYYIGVGLREAVKAGVVRGPRIHAAGRYLTTSNGLTDWYPDSVGVPQGSIGILTNSADAMVNEVRHQVKNGVDFIKVADSPSGNYQAFTDEEMRRIADMAHQLGKAVTIHARGPSEVRAAVAAGFDWIMHGNYMDDGVVEQLAQSHIPLVPTLLLLANACDWGERFGVPSLLRDRWRRMLESTTESLHKAHAAGVVFATGTDSGFSITPYGEWHARELELLVKYAGLTPLEAITAGTQNAATMVGLGGRLGTIQPGMLADVLIVRGNPAKDIRVLQDRRNIGTVIKDGLPVTFDKRVLAFRWPHARGLTYSTSDLTYDSVYGSPIHEASAELAPTKSEMDDVVHELRSLEAKAESPDDELR